MLLLTLLFSLSVHAQEVIRPVFDKKIELRIIHAEPDSFETYTLMNHNGREMSLVCANNLVYDHNPKAMIRYRNFYGEEVGDFTMENNKVCLEMAKFIETSHAGIDPQRPFLITLNPNTHRIERIEYPKINPYLDEGDWRDLQSREYRYLEHGFAVPTPIDS